MAEKHGKVKMRLARVGEEVEVTITRENKEILQFHANDMTKEHSIVGEEELMIITGYEIPAE